MTPDGAEWLMGLSVFFHARCGHDCVCFERCMKHTNRPQLGRELLFDVSVFRFEQNVSA